MENKAYTLLTALHRLGRQLHRAYHHHGHNNNHYREQSHLLFLIAANNGIIQRDLAEKMDVRPSSMTEMLIKFEHAGLIKRCQDEKDQRIMHIFLTINGWASVKQSQNDDEILASSLLHGLTENDIGTMLHLTEKLSAHLNTIEKIAPENAHHSHVRRANCVNQPSHHK